MNEDHQELSKRILSPEEEKTKRSHIRGHGFHPLAMIFLNSSGFVMSFFPRVYSRAPQAASSSESPETQGERSEKGISFQEWFKGAWQTDLK